MKVQLRPLREQTIVITGASSGIGLVTARAAAREGACVVLAARNAHDLGAAVRDIQREGGRAMYVVADVADNEDPADLIRQTLEIETGLVAKLNQLLKEVKELA